MIKHAFRGIRYGAAILGDGSPEAIAPGCDNAGNAMTTKVHPIVEKYNELVTTYKPKLNELLQHGNDALQKQQLTLETIDKTIKGSKTTVDGISKLAEKGGSLDKNADAIIAKVGGLQVDANRLNIPALMRPAAAPVIAKINGATSRIQTEATNLKTQGLNALNKSIEGATKAAKTKLEDLQRILGEGTAFRQATQQQFVKMKAAVANATQAFAKWDPKVHVDLAGAGKWFAEVGKGARAEMAQPKGPKKGEDDQWKTVVLPKAQKSVDDWRAKHTEQVRSQFHPHLPTNEIAALAQAKASLLKRARESIRDPEQLRAFEQQIAAIPMPAGEGKQSLLTLWAAEDRVAMHARAPKATGPNQSQEPNQSREPAASKEPTDRSAEPAASTNRSEPTNQSKEPLNRSQTPDATNQSKDPAGS